MKVSGTTVLETRPTSSHGPVTLAERQIAYELAPAAPVHERVAVPCATVKPVGGGSGGSADWFVCAGKSLCSSAAICAAVSRGRGTAWPRKTAVEVFTS